MALIKFALIKRYHLHMCNRVLLLFGKLPQWNLHVNCHVNGTTFQSGLRFQTGLSSLRLSCKRALTVYMENLLRFEISLRSNWPKWNLHRSEFHYARSHVNADNEVSSHGSEILPRSEISNRFEFTSGLM